MTPLDNFPPTSSEKIDKFMKSRVTPFRSPIWYENTGEPIKTDRELMEETLETMQRLERKIDLIFGKHYLINGKFVYLDIK